MLNTFYVYMQFTKLCPRCLNQNKFGISQILLQNNYFRCFWVFVCLVFCLFVLLIKQAVVIMMNSKLRETQISFLVQKYGWQRDLSNSSEFDSTANLRETASDFKVLTLLTLSVLSSTKSDWCFSIHIVNRNHVNMWTTKSFHFNITVCSFNQAMVCNCWNNVLNYSLLYISNLMFFQRRESWCQ